MHVNLSVSNSNVPRQTKLLKNLNFNELDRFFSSFQVPVNESARQVCHYLTRSARSVSFGRVRLHSEMFERARPISWSFGSGVAWMTSRYTRNAGRYSIIFPKKLLIGVFLFSVTCYAITKGGFHFIFIETWSSPIIILIAWTFLYIFWIFAYCISGVNILLYLSVITIVGVM